MSTEATSTETTETESTSTEATATETGSTATQTTDTTATETEQVTEPVVNDETQLPDTHPLVKTLATQKDELKQLRAAGTKVTELETQVAELTTKAEAANAIQAKYDRLEAFLTSLGGPVSKALDSRSFSKALFESDTDIKDLVVQWHKDNPSATSSALQSGAGDTGSTKDMNALLRSAAR